jgi:methionyl aminopeptidase
LIICFIFFYLLVAQVVEDLECSHYMKNWEAGHVPIRSKQAKSLLAHISKTYDTLAFCKRFLALDGLEVFDGALTQLVKAGLVTSHPPLVDKSGSFTAQYEHTILLRPTCKEVVSRGDDY